MRPLKALLPFDEALAMCLDLANPVERTEAVPLTASLHRVAAAAVRAPMDVPPADRAAMDGYAVVARDTSRARKFEPVVLRIQETLYADRVPTKPVTKGRCTIVATGATMPEGADAVVMVEDTEPGREAVKVFRGVRAGENVSHRGSDLRKGSVVVAKGEELTPAKVGALAAIGLDRAVVYAKPRVAILTTGDEVVDPGTAIRPGQVYDVNTHTLTSLVREVGGEPAPLGHVPDRLDALEAALVRAVAEDVVVVSGGSSVGARDLIIDAIRSQGDLLFHGIAIRPGRPTALGRVQGKPVLGMPGNPTSCLSNGYMILVPMLRRMARLPSRAARSVEARLATRVTKAPGRVDVLTVRLDRGVAVPAYKESGAITSMAHADGYVELPADVTALEKGERVRVTLF